MTGMTDTRPMATAGSRRPSLLRIYRTEAAHEFLKLIRVPIFAISTIAFPLMFYVIFGLTFADESTGRRRRDDLHAGDLRRVRRHRLRAVRLRRQRRHGAWAGMDAPQASLADAAARLLRRPRWS